ncbi:hypothetical protein DL93DRAFT_2050098 [Clavulina sp. PMI_390]|nr:hypothetical protein DL93DRAFT_2050098 [Clavulina sp. PMI_390]
MDAPASSTASVPRNVLENILSSISSLYRELYLDLPPHVVLGVLTVLVISTGYILSRDSNSKKEPYGGFQRSLNDVPGRETRTEWLNMGFWTINSQPNCTFPDACEALALKTALVACKDSGHVLDVGFGSGDSLLLQLGHNKIPRPLSLTGITSLEDHFRRSELRIKASDSYGKVPVTLYHGDAVWRQGSSGAATHPLNPISSPPQFDSILALDCAYHFNTREIFLKQCYGKLRPGQGRIALADICFEPGSGLLSQYSARLWAGALAVPSQNLVRIRDYESQLEKIGYTDIHVQDITLDVFPGFIAFLSSRGFLWGIFARMMGMWWRAGGRFVIVSARAGEAR